VRVADERPEAAVRAVAVDPAAIVDAGVAQDAAARRRAVARRPAFRVERVAGLDGARMFAISGEALFRVREGRWQPLSLDGGVARDVLALRGALWVLVEGRGDNAGRALILRSNDGDSLEPVWAVSNPLGQEAGTWAIRALALRAGAWVIAGARPALVRVEAGGARVEFDAADASYQRAYGLQDDSVVCTREDGDLDVLRYGTRTHVVSDGLLAGVFDLEGFGYVVHEDGAVWRGRPAKELRRVVGAASFEPRAAAVLRDGRVALVGAGGPFAMARGSSWQVVPGDWPTEPVAIVAAEPPLVVGRDGAVVAVEGQGRTVVSPGISAANEETL
jgi:hypothetical protein